MADYGTRARGSSSDPLGEVVHSDFELDADAFMQAFGVESMLRSAADGFACTCRPLHPPLPHMSRCDRRRAGGGLRLDHQFARDVPGCPRAGGRRRRQRRAGCGSILELAVELGLDAEVLRGDAGLEISPDAGFPRGAVPVAQAYAGLPIRPLLAAAGRRPCAAAGEWSIRRPSP